MRRLEYLLEQANNDELIGLMDVCQRADGRQQSGVSGTYMNDLDAAVISARDGFNCLLSHRACLEIPNQLPRRLRKEH